VREDELRKGAFLSTIVWLNGASLDRLNHPAHERIISFQVKDQMTAALIANELVLRLDTLVKVLVQLRWTQMVIHSDHEAHRDAVDRA